MKSREDYERSESIISTIRDNFSQERMSTYEEVLSQVKHLTPTEQNRLLEALTVFVSDNVEVEDSDEIIPLSEIAESEAAWQDYLAGHDSRISSEELKLKLFGKKTWLTGNTLS